MAKTKIIPSDQLWAPIGEQPQFDSEKAEVKLEKFSLEESIVFPKVVMRRNEVMLEETRDTITVPASLMIRRAPQHVQDR